MPLVTSCLLGALGYKGNRSSPGQLDLKQELSSLNNKNMESWKELSLTTVIGSCLLYHRGVVPHAWESGMIFFFFLSFVSIQQIRRRWTIHLGCFKYKAKTGKLEYTCK